MRHDTTLSLVFLALLSGTALFVTARADEWDDLDEPVQNVPVQLTTDNPAASYDAVSEQKAAPLPQRSSDRTLLYAVITFLGFSMFVAVVGGRANAKRTLAFEEAFCSEPGGLLRKHFSRLGKGQGQLLVNESSSTCKLHANGHQHLEGAVITLTMLRRHELVSYVTQKIGQQEDVLCLEMYVKEGHMPPMVMAIATPSTHKELLRNHQDVKLLAQRLEVKEEKLRDWPKENLIVYSEHPSYFYDMMTKPMLAQVFGAVAFLKQRRYFRGLQISSESNSSHRKVIRCWLTLPAAESMADLSTLLQAALAMVNQVATYSISPERQKQVEKAHRDFAKQTGRKEPSAFAREVMEVSRSKQKRK